jgi:hypothetical protein
MTNIFTTNPGEITDFAPIPTRDIVGNLFKELDENRLRLGERSRSIETEGALQVDEARSFVDSVLSQTKNVPQEESVDYNAPVPGTNEGYRSGVASSDNAPPVTRDVPNQPQFVTKGGKDPVDFIFNSEAQRDKAGRLKVYNPPSGDGGGAFEVAGITARYQPKEAAKLRDLIQQGKHKEAETYAKDFYRKRAEPFIKYTDKAGIQLQLADTVHHRGEGGLRRVLQRATGSNSKSYEDLIGQLNEDPKALDKFNRARVDYEMEEIDRGRASRQKFKKGLLNRFKNADIAARQL